MECYAKLKLRFRFFTIVIEHSVVASCRYICSVTSGHIHSSCNGAAKSLAPNNGLLFVISLAEVFIISARILAMDRQRKRIFYFCIREKYL